MTQNRNTFHLPPGYTPREDATYMSDDMRTYFRQKLVALRDHYLRDSANHVDALLNGRDFQERDSIDYGDLESEREREQDILIHERSIIDDIERALASIEAGEYGYCIDTGEEIGIDRLETWPLAIRTVDAQARHDNNVEKRGMY